MRRTASPLFLLLPICTLVLAVPAQASIMDFQGTLEIEVLGVKATSVVSGQANVAPDGSFTLPSALFLLAATSTPANPGINYATIFAGNQAGAFAPAGTGFGGVMPLFRSAYFYFQLPTGSGPSSSVVPIPLAAVGGIAGYTPFIGPVGAVYGSISGSSWTAGVAQVTAVTATTGQGAPTTMLQKAGFDARTPFFHGNIQLVTPIRIVLEGTTINGSYGSFGVLTLRFPRSREVPGLAGPGIALLASLVVGGGARLLRRQH